MKNKIAKNTLFLYILTFSNYFLGLMLFPYLSRVLSVEKFGLVGFSMS
ncbi:TPA: oligosaccharide flippase family protein, partial [Streptococcus suis]